MSKWLHNIAAVLVVSVMISGVANASDDAIDSGYKPLLKKAVFECGNFETAQASVVGPFLSAIGRQPEQVDMLSSIAENNFFLLTFLDCQCRGRVNRSENIDGGRLAKCLLEAKVATQFYAETLPVPLGVMAADDSNGLTD